MSVARTTEISSTSPTSFQDAIELGIARATKTLREVQGAWVKEMKVDVNNGQITSYKVHMLVTFILEE